MNDPEWGSLIAASISESVRTKETLHRNIEEIRRSGLLLADSLEKGGKILLAGNGGSAADAQHIAAELVVRFKGGNERRALPAMTLSPDPSTITACGNDYGYDRLFERGVEAFGRAGDAFVGISTSGNSRNIILAVQKAQELKLKTILLLGNGGGKLKGAADETIIVASEVTARIQECHILIGHILCAIIEKKLFNLN